MLEFSAILQRRGVAHNVAAHLGLPNMPTWDTLPQFENEYKSLAPERRVRFRVARREFIRVLLAWERAGMPARPSFPKHLGVKRLQGYRGIWELAWEGDGRCTWEYGDPQKPGTCHIIWRRVGSDAIYDNP